MASLILPLISGLAGLFGGDSTKKTTTDQTASQTGTASGNTSSSNTPQLSDLQSLLANITGSAAIDQYKSGPSTIQATKIAGEQSIDANEQAAQKSVSNTLAARGLAYSPYAGTALAQPVLNAANQQSQLAESLPILSQQLNNQNISTLEGAFSATGPVGSTSTGSTSGTTSQNSSQQGTQIASTPGGGIAGLLSGLGAGFAAPSAGKGSASNLSSIFTSLGIG